MMVPDHSVAMLIKRADDLRKEFGLRADQPIKVQATFEHDWPVEALVQLANRLGEFYIELEVIMAHGDSGTSQPPV